MLFEGSTLYEFPKGNSSFGTGLIQTLKQRFQTKGAPRKINIEPEDTPLEEDNHLQNHHFQVQSLIFGGFISVNMLKDGRK